MATRSPDPSSVARRFANRSWERSPKALTPAQVGKIYEAGKKSYQSSYAKMVDDIFAGIKKATAKLGFEPFYDVEWFRLMGSGIRESYSWSSLPPDMKERIVRAINPAVDE